MKKNILYLLFSSALCFFCTSSVQAQEITIESNLDSIQGTNVFNCAAGLTFNPIINTNCASGIQTVTLEVDLGNDGSIDHTTAGSFGGDFPLGLNLLTVQATDNCGNTETVSFQITVIDDVAPVAICNTLLNIGIWSNNDEFVLLPSMINENSVDNCTDAAQLDMTLAFLNSGNLQDSLIITGSQAGMQTVELHVTDAEGNTNVCVSELDVRVFTDCPGDTIPPIAVCDAYTIATFGVNGVIRLFAETFDDGSTDDCDPIPTFAFTIVDSVSGDILRPIEVVHDFTANDIGVHRYRLYVTDNEGNVNTCEGTLEIRATTGNLIYGNVFIDANGDCEKGSSEVGTAGWRIRGEAFPSGNTAERASDADGDYFLPMIIERTDTIVKVSTINTLNASQTCQNIFYIHPDSIQNFTYEQDIPISLVPNCAQLNVDIGAPFLRRCFPSTYHVSYSNYGTDTAYNAYVEVTLDSFFVFTNSSIPHSSVSGQTYTFDLGDVPPATSERFTITGTISCQAVLGQTHCSQAVIYPNGDCHPHSDNWSRASVQVDGYCQNDSIHFSIQNVGTGDMSQAMSYIIIEDIIIHKVAPFQLDAGEAIEFVTAGKGRTCRIEAEQEPFHPGNSNPSVTIEGCGTLPGGGISLGFVTMLPQDDSNPWVSIDCQENIGAYDPNDKSAFPKGVGNRQFIKANTDIEYKIRFQNTGTDTAFNVVIEDVLPLPLDVTTVLPGTSSHPYNFEMEEDGTLRFIFENILLPDSSTNLEASNGFVQFRVSQVSDNPDGTLIENTAAIYFDFNEPIITNVAFHEVGSDFILVSAKEVFAPELSLDIQPNPFNHRTRIQLDGSLDERHSFQLYNASGQLLLQETFWGDTYELQPESAVKGLLFFTIQGENGAVMASGKLLRQ